MTGKKFKFIGACGAALMLFSTVTPASAVLFGDATVAQAATVTGNYLKDANYEQGTFTQSDLTNLLAKNLDVTTSVDLGSGVGLFTRLFPGASGFIRDSLGLTDSDQYKIIYSTNLDVNTTLLQLNQRTTPIIATFEVTNLDGTKTGKTFTASININSSTVVVNNLSKALGDKFKAEEGITVTDVTGKALEYVAGTTPTANKYTVEDISDSETIAANYTDGTVYNKLANNFAQRLKITYLNSAGVTVEKIVDRTVNIAASAASMPYLALVDSAGNPIGGTGGDIYYTNGQTVNSAYSYEMEALNQTPIGGNAAYLTGKVVNVASGIINIENSSNSTTTSGTQLYVLPSSDGSSTTLDGNVVINADGVDFTTPGNYTYTVTAKNTAGVTSTFTLPLVVKAVNNAPTYTYDVGYSDTMTIKVNTPFNPLDGITFYEKQGGDKITDTSRITYVSNVNNAVPGTYTVVYTVTNKLGNTTKVTRTVNVVSEIQGTTVYRLYNQFSGEHFYTASLSEYNGLVAAGWTGEGKGFSAATSGAPVYRLLNPTTGEHFYTTSSIERDGIVGVGWTYEGVAFYSLTASTGTPVYRAFNPNAQGPGSHLFTVSKSEIDGLTPLGWIYEGEAFYAMP